MHNSTEAVVVPQSVSELIRSKLPQDKMVELIAEGLLAEKPIHSRAEGVVYSPDWQARVRYMELRMKLGGELAEEPLPQDGNKIVNIFVNGKKQKPEKVEE